MTFRRWWAGSAPLALCGGLLAAPAQAPAQGLAPPRPAIAPAAATPESRALQLQSLAASCAACHGSAGHAVDDSVVPGLAGRPAGELAAQMRAFKAGTRSATVMQQIAKGYDEPQIDQLAAFFAAQPKVQPK